MTHIARGSAISANRFNLLLGLVIAAACLGLTRTARGVTLTFSDQPDGDGVMSPNKYMLTQGFPATITATFVNFRHTDFDSDHTQNGDSKLIYGANNTTPTTITFNVPVEVPTFWLTTGSFGGSTSATVVGSLSGAEQFRYVNSGATDTFHEVTGGAGKQVDLLTFTSFRNSEVDDLTIQSAPEPGTGILLLVSPLIVLTRRRRAFCRFPIPCCCG